MADGDEIVVEGWGGMLSGLRPCVILQVKFLAGGADRARVRRRPLTRSWPEHGEVSFSR